MAARGARAGIALAASPRSAADGVACARLASCSAVSRRSRDRRGAGFAFEANASGMRVAAVYELLLAAGGRRLRGLGAAGGARSCGGMARPARADRRSRLRSGVPARRRALRYCRRPSPGRSPRWPSAPERPRRCSPGCSTRHYRTSRRRRRSANVAAAARRIAAAAAAMMISRSSRVLLRRRRNPWSAVRALTPPAAASRCTAFCAPSAARRSRGGSGSSPAFHRRQSTSGAAS